jgi:hypothetical protein
MLDVLLFFVVMVAAGYVLRRAGLMQPESAKDLNNAVFYVTLPPLIFKALHGASLSASMLVLPAIAWVLSLAVVGTGYAIARLLKLPRHQAGAFILALGFANTTFLGYPIIQGFYGTEHLTLAIFYDMLGATMAVNTLGVLVASSTGEGEASAKAIFRRLLGFPPIWALLAGLALHGVALPAPLETLLTNLSQLTTPLIMLSLGLSLQFRHWRTHLPLVGLVALGRLVLLPLLALTVARVMGLPKAYEQVVVLQAAMPTMFYSLTLAMVFGLETMLVINAIMVTTILSFVTLPLWHALLAH